MTPAPETILATERLMMRFGGLFAVNELDLNVRQGAIHSIIGPNGAGKTTVFNCIMENLLVGMHLHLRSHWWGALINSPHTRRSEKGAHDEALKLLRFVGLKGR